MFYYRGLQQWPHIKEYLRDTCLAISEILVLLLRMNTRSCWIISAYNIIDWYWISNGNPVFKQG